MLFVFRDIYLLMSWIIKQHTTTTTTTTTSTTMTTTTATILWVKKEQRYYSFITAANDGRFSKFFHFWIQQKICNKSLAAVAAATHWQWMLCAVSRQSTWVQQPSSNSLSGWYITVTHTCHCIHRALSRPYHRRSLQVRTTQLSYSFHFVVFFLNKLISWCLC